MTSFVQPLRMIETEPVTRLPRQDALPEHVDYRDEGCDLFPSCLACPLVRCRFDVPGGVRTMLNRVRDREIHRMREELEVPVDEIAERFRVSRRTVFRVLQQRPLRHTHNGQPANGHTPTESPPPRPSPVEREGSPERTN